MSLNGIFWILSISIDCCLVKPECQAGTANSSIDLTCLAFWQIYRMFSCQLRFYDNITPTNLVFWIHSIIVPSTKLNSGGKSNFFDLMKIKPCTLPYCQYSFIIKNNITYSFTSMLKENVSIKIKIAFFQSRLNPTLQPLISKIIVEL